VGFVVNNLYKAKETFLLGENMNKNQLEQFADIGIKDPPRETPTCKDAIVEILKRDSSGKMLPTRAIKESLMLLGFAHSNPIVHSSLKKLVSEGIVESTSPKDGKKKYYRLKGSLVTISGEENTSEEKDLNPDED